DAALAAKAEPEPRAVHPHLPLAQRGEPERFVLASVLLVADARSRRLEQPHHRREHFLARQAGAREIARNASPDGLRRGRARAPPAVFRLVAHLAPAPVVAVLLALARVAAGRLKVAVVGAANPHVAPGRRDGERADAAQRAPVAHGIAVGMAVV